MPFEKMRGVYGAPLMPVDADLNPDIPRYLEHCRWLLAQGCDGLMPLGSTGESHSFTVDERCTVIDALVGSGMDPATMLIGTNALALPDAARLARHAVEAGAGRICVQPAFYYKPTDDGLYGYYAKLIEMIGDDRTRLMIYDWAPNTGVHFSLEVLGRLYADFPGVITGIKDSDGDAALLAERGRAFPEHELLGGTDVTALAAMRAGGCGIMSSAANIAPGHICGIYRHWQDAEGERLQAEVNAMLAILKSRSYFAALKGFTAARTGESGWARVRPPLKALSEAECQSLKAEIDAVGKQVAA